MSNYFFGSKESRRADADREEKNKQRIQELADRGGSTQPEKKVDKFGRELDVAAIVDPSINKQYVQSTTWDGLERIGSEQWVRERADQGEQYVGFLPWKRVQLDAAQWQMLLHHVTVEALTLQKAGRDVEQVCWPRIGSAANWEATRNARLQASVDGGVTVHFGTPEDEGTILASIPTTLPEKLATNPHTPNVTVHARRQTPIDREKNVGRWKVIEEELVQRGLPVTGTRFRGAKVEVQK